MTATLRDWQPGDGIQCSFARMASRGIPCGPPVKTSEDTVSGGPGRKDRLVRRPLCAAHAAGRTGGPTPSDVTARAEKKAVQQLVATHWNEYQELVSRFRSEEATS